MEHHVISDNENAKASIGIDIGGTKICMGLISPEGKILRRLETKTGPDLSYKAVGEKIANHMADLLGAVSREDVKAVGFGLPGTTDSEQGFIEFAPNLGWRNVPFGSFMREKLGSDMYFVQETHAAVLAEYLFGAGRGCEDIACVAIGTGVGCGLMLKGQLYRGAFNIAGELGHIIVEKNGKLCACGRVGCLEAYGSGPSIAKSLRDQIGDAQDLKTEDLFRMAREGREDIRREIIGLVEYIGMGLVNIVNLLSPEKIIITGGLSEQDELVIGTLRDYVKNHSYSIAADKVAVVKAQLGKDAPMIGAAMLYHFIEPFAR